MKLLLILAVLILASCARPMAPLTHTPVFYLLPSYHPAPSENDPWQPPCVLERPLHSGCRKAI